ncbi:Ribosomal large subunit pseudouridine synthase D [Planctomycetes bacterium CA13]|uniref:Pseudouridine synthase n=1 Tax=Novipirellula herctigrandis TaxID=2527986 RepID=A0A5C5Z9T4_9BACT|nr:Ribosomal large subunit pseudouridine synthase D [Planctomycetes bacterium CA13]
MPITTLSTTVQADAAGRVDLVIRDLAAVSRSQVRGLVDHGCVSVNGNICRNIGATVKEGDSVSIRFDPAQRYREKKKSWEDRTFSVLYEDDILIVVDKSAGSLTVPTDNKEKNSLVDRVSVYLSHSRGEREAFVVHRLDREVSGLLVFGKRKDVADALIEQFKQRKPERFYIAIVSGVMDRDEGKFHSHLATGNNLDRYITRPSANTEEAITLFRVLKRMQDTTLVELQLETGKRNQIRVQLADVGHPVLGDPRYQTKKAQHPRWVRKRIALHAKSLSFVHPGTGEMVSFESPLPSAMEKFIAFREKAKS